MLSLVWKVYKEKGKKKTHHPHPTTPNEQKDMERTMWKSQVADGTEVTTASRGMFPQDFQSDFLYGLTQRSVYSEKKPDYVEMNFYKKGI